MKAKTVHELNGKELKNLELITHFIITVYAPIWFDIKCFPLYHQAPRHILKSIKLCNIVSPEIKQIALTYIQRNAYSAHQENLLLVMVADTNVDVRKKLCTLLKV